MTGGIHEDPVTASSRGLQAEVGGPYSSFAQLMKSRTDDDEMFLIWRGADGRRAEWSVAAFRDAVFNCASQVAGAGVRPAARVAVPAVNTPEALIAIFACWTAHACCVPLDIGTRDPREWAHDALVADCDFVVTVDGAAGPIGARELGLSSPSLIVVDPTLHAPWEGPLAVDSTDHALCLYSSGTTGTPKGINLSYDNLFVNFESMRAAFAWGAADRVITVLPISHGNGLLIGSLLPWFCGSSMVLCERFSATAFWEIVRQEGATQASVVPTVLAYLDADPGADWPASFRGFVSGSGPLSRALARRIASRGPRIRQIYGLSETTCVATMTPAGDDRALDFTPHPSLEHLVSVGAALPNVEVAVLDEGGRRQAAGSVGELAVRGTLIMQGYHDRVEPATDSAGWLRTGDEGCWTRGPDGEPWFFVTGRLKDLIIRGGLNISPLEIEDALLRHPGVDEAMAFGVPDEALGEAIGVAVVSEAGVSVADLQEHVKATLERPKRPIYFYRVDSIPKTRSGKIRRGDLAKQLLEIHPT